MPAYLLVDLDVHDPEGFAAYRAAVPALIHAHGGRYLVRGGAAEALEGDRRPNRTVLLEFPSMDAARAFWNDPAYAEVAAIRRASSTGEVILVEGLDRPL